MVKIRLSHSSVERSCDLRSLILIEGEVFLETVELPRAVNSEEIAAFFVDKEYEKKR